MKKVKLIALAAATFITGSVMAQTDTTNTPTPDTIPSKPDTTKPEDSISVTKKAGTSVAYYAALKVKDAKFFALTNRELLNSKSEAVKEEEETEA